MIKDNSFVTALKKYKATYIMLIPCLVLVFVFSYVPIPGIIVAFKDFDMIKGIFRSPWIGFDNFVRVFTLPDFTKAIGNTLLYSVLNLLLIFPAPLVFALLLNEIKNKFFKRFV